MIFWKLLKPLQDSWTLANKSTPDDSVSFPHAPSSIMKLRGLCSANEDQDHITSAALVQCRRGAHPYSIRTVVTSEIATMRIVQNRSGCPSRRRFTEAALLPSSLLSLRTDIEHSFHSQSCWCY